MQLIKMPKFSPHRSSWVIKDARLDQGQAIVPPPSNRSSRKKLKRSSQKAFQLYISERGRVMWIFNKVMELFYSNIANGLQTVVHPSLLEFSFFISFGCVQSAAQRYVRLGAEHFSRGFFLDLLHYWFSFFKIKNFQTEYYQMLLPQLTSAVPTALCKHRNKYAIHT